MTNSYNPIKAGFWYTFSNILIKSIPFLTLPIFTRLLTTEDFGIYNVYLSYESIISVIIGLGLAGTIRAASVNYSNNLKNYVSSIIILQLFVSLFLFPFVILFLRLLAKDWLIPIIVVALILHSISSALIGVLTNAYGITGNVKSNIITSFLITILNIILSLFFIIYIFKGKRFIGRIIGTSISYFIVASIFSCIYIKKEYLNCLKDFWKYGFKLGLPLLPHLLSMIIFSQCDKLMIQKLIGYSETGIYSLGVTICLVLSVIVQSIDNAWAPWFFKKLREKQYSNILSANNKLSKFFFLIQACFILLLPDIVHIFARSDYWGCIPSATILAVSVFTNFMYLFSVNTEYFFQKTGCISLFTLISVIINIVLNFIFISLWGIIGAAIATFISRFILYVLHSIQKRHLIKEKIISEIYLILELIILCLISFIVCFTNNIIVRWLCFIPFFISLLLMIKNELFRKTKN